MRLAMRSPETASNVYGARQDNVLRTMLKKDLPLGAEPPEPSKFQGMKDS